MKIIVAIVCGILSALSSIIFPDFACTAGWFGCGLMITINQEIDAYRLNKKHKSF